MSATAQALVRLGAAHRRLRSAPTSVRCGRLVRVNGLILEVEGLPLELDQRALIRTGDGRTIEACCVSFNHGVTYLMALDADTGQPLPNWGRQVANWSTPRVRRPTPGAVSS